MKRLLLLTAIATLFVGCAARPLKPGEGVIRSAAGAIGIVRQSENPATDSTQKYERISDGDKVTERIETKVGAAQKDLAREAMAKLASLRPVMYLGVAVFLFGAVSAFWPPLKLVIGSTTTSAIIALAGLALTFLPTIIVGQEALIMLISLGAALAWFFAHRHGKARGELETLKR